MVFLTIFCLLVYLEGLYHVFGYGVTPINPLFVLGLCLCVAGIESFFVNLFQKKTGNFMLWLVLWLDVILYGSQLIYLRIFKQPLLWSAVVHGGADALTNYWKEALNAVLAAWLPVLLFVFPLILIAIWKKKWEAVPREWRFKQRKNYVLAFAVGVIFFCIGKMFGGLQNFSDPKAVFEEYGVLTAMQCNLQEMLFEKSGEKIELDFKEPVDEYASEEEQDHSGSDDKVTEESKEETVETPEEEEKDLSPNVLPIDFRELIEKEDREEVRNLHQYIEKRIPTKKNEYTGMFKDYNLIYLTAEGFAPYCVDEKLTPTLYKLLNSGFRFENYYVPLWHTSTSDGEFSNCTGLLPDKQFSFSRSVQSHMSFELPAFFEKEGIKSRAYHNGSLSYYDRHLTHENLGYFFKAGTLGKLPAQDWQENIFPLENPKAWPQSDLEMMQGTLPEYIEEPRFHAYYMTISGHLQYTFNGNSMAYKNREAVQDLPYSNNAKAYIACNIELDKALEWLISELDKAGKLDNTVICMGADHYPYGLEENEIEELRGTPLGTKRELYHNGLILWNSKMEPVTVEKPCSSMDILPTLLNLFGFEYDSRLYCGQDILSDSNPLVVFADKSFLTDQVYYDARTGEVESLNETENEAVYVENMKKQVNNLFALSAGILDYDYYNTLSAYAPAVFK